MHTIAMTMVLLGSWLAAPTPELTANHNNLQVKVRSFGQITLSYMPPGSPTLNALRLQTNFGMENNWLGLMAMPRFVIKSGTGFEGNSHFSLRDAYVYAHNPRWGELRLGKMMEQFGRAWDFGAYGTVLALTDGYNLYGLGADYAGSQSLRHPAWSVGYRLQYFPVDGQVLSSANQQIYGTPRRLNTTTLNVALQNQPASNLDNSLGLAGAWFQTGVHQHFVQRYAVVFEQTLDQLEWFGQIGVQLGDDQDRSGSIITSYTYGWVGLCYNFPQWQVYLNFSMLRYFDDAIVVLLQQPGLAWQINRVVKVIVEAALLTSTQTSNQAYATKPQTEAFAIIQFTL